MRNFFIVFIFCFGIITPGYSQHTFFPIHSEEYILLDRLETMQGQFAGFNTSFKPISRKDAVDFFQQSKRNALYQETRLSNIDLYQIERALSISGEWVETATGLDGAIRSEKPILKYFYETQANFLHVQTEDFFVVANPIIYTQGIKERNQEGMKYINLRGAEIRGRILNKVGFYTILADNQEKPISIVSEAEGKNHAFPGIDYYRKTEGGNYDMFLARGYIDVDVITDHVNISFGYDHNFIGNGMRSLFLSHETAPSTFLRFRSKFGRFEYENLFLELVADYKRGGDQILPRKYAALHQLNYKISPRLEIGLFESTIFAHQDHFALDYIIPIIGYRTASRALGAPDKTSLGFHFKAIPFRGFQLYGQALFDQIKFKEIGNGWWGNQYAFQLGGKYFDALTIPNLNLQGEINVVRPFMYQSAHKMTNYTHYNQPLAHPYGAGFAEIIGFAHYQPLPKMYLSSKIAYSLRGTDRDSSSNFGNDLFKNTNSRSRDNEIDIAAGKQLNTIYLNLHVAYEWKPRLFFELGASGFRRNFIEEYTSNSSISIYGGIRWNFSRKEYY